MKKFIVIATVALLGMGIANAQATAEQAECGQTELLVENQAGMDMEAAAQYSAVQDASFPTEAVLDVQATLESRHPSRIAASVLGILLGDLGIQHFYIGQTLRGVVDILFSWTGIPAVVGIVEGIIWLAEGEAAWEDRVARWNN